MSREALSLDISRLVSRVVSGEPVDIAERGAALAAKYPELGMSGALIGQAIERAAGMVGMIRNAPEPQRPAHRPTETAAALRRPEGSALADGRGAANGQAANGHSVRELAAKVDRPDPPAVTPATSPVAAWSIEEDLAAAIDAEIGNLVAGTKAKPAAARKPVPEARLPRAPIPVLPKAETRPAPAASALPKSDVPLPSTAPVAATAPKEAAAMPTRPAHSSILATLRRVLFRT